MDRENELLKKLDNLRVSAPQGRRSPHKPLLLLMSIGRYINGHTRLATLEQIEEDLNRLLRRYGLPNSRENAHYPFWHLQGDGLWQVDRPELVTLTSSGQPHVADLRTHEVQAGFSEDFFQAMETGPEFAWWTIHALLTKYFPPSLHDDILRDVGLSRVSPSWLMKAPENREERNLKFEEVVLQAYNSQCAICGFDVQFMGQAIGIEAAHIKWHCANGPAQIRNGIAMCLLHQKFFDSGLFTILPDLTVQVGRTAVGESLQESLTKYAGHQLNVTPAQWEQRPAANYLQWHKLAVFKG